VRTSGVLQMRTIALFAFRFRYRYSFICQGTSTRRQRRDLFGLPSSQAVTCFYQSNYSKGRGNPVKCLDQGHNKRTCRLIFTLSPFLCWTSSREAVNTNIKFWPDSAREFESWVTDYEPDIRTTRPRAVYGYYIYIKTKNSV